MHLLKLSPENLKIMNKKKYIYWFSCVLLTIALVAFDQFTKYIAVDKLKDNDSFVIFNGIFELFYVENKGAAYGIFSGRTSLFVIITSLILPLVIFEIYRISKMIGMFGDKVNVCALRWLQVDLFILIAGAVGNLIDRLIQGYVVDFFYFKLIDFPVFNVADCYITVASAVVIIICFFILKGKEVDYLFDSQKKWLVEDECK